MKTLSYLIWLALMATTAVPATARVLSFAGGGLAGPRLSTGDGDGDGTVDAALCGTNGGGARVDWYAAPGLPNVSWSQLPVAADLAHADLDGDGRHEIIVVGARRWHVLQTEGGILRGRAHGATTSPLWRVAAADVDGDGRDELALVTLQRGLVDEIPQAVVELVDLELTPTGAELRVLDTWDVAGHVGDLCFAASTTGPVLIVETGAEEVGGRLQRLETTGGVLRETGTVRTGNEGLRILSLSAITVGRRTLLSLGDVTGRIRLVEWLDGGLRRFGEAPLSGAGAALSGPAGDAQMWIAPRHPGEPLGWWSSVQF
ncbi:MAG TPA: VCBS repeat-containing protein [Candidatus Latescibacteria bacterium]|jgi:hypothetical protein|nr:VCBS repeat-containing protein [Candidatus Latescibacterota bacterium]HJP29456.1 VCBS repeat-containing protein [Candidatus Latescibacterota bacterium]